MPGVGNRQDTPGKSASVWSFKCDAARKLRGLANHAYQRLPYGLGGCPILRPTNEQSAISHEAKKHQFFF